ncbi:Allergen V5/Tpx-1-related [Macleaya cordata]|uniref:Allergen V5/Tpx-1-related n=1 Tax=Macleaya cordata TaxID=56857 RepID=A0A200QRL0_MACCD|nr:Allergen V5/Tpx-1-related [Macleaya cordata]
MGSSSSTSLLFSLFLFCFLSFIQSNHAKVNSTEFIDQIMEGHNMAREAVGVPPLVWEQNLATYAKAYLEYRRHDCKLIYSEPYTFGENLFTGPGITAKDAVDAWVAEKQWYNYENNTCLAGKDCTDYTQVVWRTTIRVGCGQIKCDTGDIFIACEYYPAGNYKGARPY